MYLILAAEHPIKKDLFFFWLSQYLTVRACNVAGRLKKKKKYKKKSKVVSGSW